MEGGLIFAGVCAACHGKGGEGMVGPNLTDENWIHGGGIKNIFKVIKYGVPEKGMISWQSQLKPDDMRKVASYILSLKGTNPPNAKAPQGEIWTETAESDTTKVQKQ
jgi:cytochrome c oxidase cbb3-type subunit 3